MVTISSGLCVMVIMVGNYS